MDGKLKQILEQVYFLLRDYGYVAQSEAIKRLIFFMDKDDKKKFREEFKSPLIWGGAGSIFDIDLKDTVKQKELDACLKEIKELGSRI